MTGYNPSHVSFSLAAHIKANFGPTLQGVSFSVPPNPHDMLAAENTFAEGTALDPTDIQEQGTVVTMTVLQAMQGDSKEPYAVSNR